MSLNQENNKMIITLEVIEITAKLLEYAKKDLSVSKKHGSMAIYDTKKGNVEIQYSPQTKLFKAVNFNNTNVEFTGDIDAKSMVNFIASIYIVNQRELLKGFILEIPTVLKPPFRLDIDYPCPICDCDIYIDSINDEVSFIECEPCDIRIQMKIRDIS